MLVHGLCDFKIEISLPWLERIYANKIKEWKFDGIKWLDSRPGGAEKRKSEVWNDNHLKSLKLSVFLNEWLVGFKKTICDHAEGNGCVQMFFVHEDDFTFRLVQLSDERHAGFFEQCRNPVCFDEDECHSHFGDSLQKYVRDFVPSPQR